MADKTEPQCAVVEPVLTTDHPVAQCVNLRATFGGRYRYEWDEAYYAERSRCRKVEAPWLTTILCKFGKIYPHGGRRLAAYCDAGGVKRRQLQGLACVEVTQGGGKCAEVIVTFDVADIEAVAAVLQPRRPRRYSPKARSARAAQLARVRPWRKRVKSTVSSGLLSPRRRVRRSRGA